MRKPTDSYYLCNKTTDKRIPLEIQGKGGSEWNYYWIPHSRRRGRGILPPSSCISPSLWRERERIGWIRNGNKCHYGKLFIFEWSSRWWTTGRSWNVLVTSRTGLRIANSSHSQNSQIRLHFSSGFDQSTRFISFVYFVDKALNFEAGFI